MHAWAVHTTCRNSASTCSCAALVVTAFLVVRLPNRPSICITTCMHTTYASPHLQAGQCGPGRRQGPNERIVIAKQRLRVHTLHTGRNVDRGWAAEAQCFIELCWCQAWHDMKSSKQLELGTWSARKDGWHPWCSIQWTAVSTDHTSSTTHSPAAAPGCSRSRVGRHPGRTQTDPASAVHGVNADMLVVQQACAASWHDCCAGFHG